MSDAEERAWEVVRRAYEERTPAPRRSRARFAAPALAAFAAVAVLAVVSPPGRAVFQRVREAVGIRHADAALSLPSPGRLLVVSGGGVWLVRENGFKRRLGAYSDGQWSPHGLFAVMTAPNRIVALDLDHGVRWSLARRGARWPRWEGTRTDTRIAYVSRSGLRVVAGDGTDDRLLAAHATSSPPAWQPTGSHVLAFVQGVRLVVEDVDTRRVVASARLRDGRPASLAWSSDGRYLAAVAARHVDVFDGRGVLRRTITSLSGAILEGAFRPGTHQLAVSVRSDLPSRHSSIRLVDVDHHGVARQLFAGPGVFGDMTWSPDGTWLLVDWRTANQWLFVTAGAGPRVHAVANIRAEFPRPDDRPPQLSFQGRWCCR